MIVIRASELGSCIKAQVAKHLGHKPLPTSDRMQEIYDRGNEHEDANAAALRAMGAVIRDEQAEVALDLGAARVEGHLDGYVSRYISAVEDQWRVWESKSPSAWGKFQKAHLTADWSDPLAHRYAWQISCYMIATGLEAMVTCLDGEEVRSFVIEVPPFGEDLISYRAELIADDVRAGILPSVCSQNDWPCPFSYLHEEPEYDVDPELDKAATDYHFAGLQIKEWKAKQDRAKKKVTDILGDRESVKTEAFTVTAYEQKAPVKYDMDGISNVLVSLGQELEQYRVEGKPASRIKITAKGERDDA